MKIRIKKFFLSAVISFGLLYYAFYSFHVQAVFEAITDAGVIGLCLAFLLIVSAYFLRAARWRIWEKNLSFQESFELIMIGFMGNNLFPARLGEFIRAYCTAHKTGEGYGGTAALGSVAAERVLDGLAVSLIGFAGLLLVPVKDFLFYPLLVVTSGCGILVLIFLLSIRYHRRIRSLLGRIHAVFPGHLTHFGMEKSNYFLDGLILIRSSRKFFFALILTGLVWGAELFAYGLIARSVWPGFALKTTLIFLPVVNFASLFPFVIGGIGAIEGAASLYLRNAGVPENHALAMVLIQHGFQFALTVICGVGIYLLLGYFLLPKPEREDRSSAAASKDAVEKPPAVADALLKLKDISCDIALELKPEKGVEISLVIPAYNEQNRLPKTVLETLSWCSRNVYEYEILIVDDGSSDDTLEIAKLFSRQVPQIRYVACPHQGKGATVRMGMLNAAGRYVLFMDADGATPLEEIPKIIAPIQKGADIAIGSRVVQHPDETSVITSFHRKIMGRTFSGLVNILITPGIGDTQCGFKAFRYNVIKPIFTRQQLKGFAFDVEILFIARKLGLLIREVPVNWVNQAGSKVNIVTDSIKMFFDVLRIRWCHKNEKWDEERFRRS